MALTGYPDGQPKSFPNQQAGVNVSSGAVGVNFGFGAALIKLANDGPGPCYLFLNTTDVTKASTAASAASGNVGPWTLTTGDLLTDVYDLGVQVSGFAYVTTSTTNSLRYAAWG